MKIDKDNQTKMKRLITAIFGKIPSTKLYNNLIKLTLLYNDFIVNIYIQLDWEQVFTTY
jgi:hypothetical protein